MPYFCPRCKVSLPKKYSLQSHFARRNPCNPRNNITLTEEIKEKSLMEWNNITELLSFLSNEGVINHQGSQPNDMLKILYDIDIKNKYDILISHFGISRDDMRQQNDILDNINDICRKHIIDVYKGHFISSNSESLYPELTESDFLIIFRNAICFDNNLREESTQKQLLNIVCMKEEVYDSIYYFDNKEWNNCHIEYLLKHLLDYFTPLLKAYEEYTIKAIYTISPHKFTHKAAKNRLINFYKMIAQFRDKSYVKGMNDVDIFPHVGLQNLQQYITKSDTKIVDECVEQFNYVKRNFCNTEILESLKNLIKGVSQQNTEFINHHLFHEMYKNNDLYKKLKTLQNERREHNTRGTTSNTCQDKYPDLKLVYYHHKNHKNIYGIYKN